ncbi:dephospho-CoA kinase [Brevibacillus massiliensis]|uniref:dephospho-CoA kinase n=1 Tax=Brevibacillus massiliensis TaxID=1118054 RepID=UPI0002DBD8FE|nr:dephospho-CoA kinase [Brevibacillus massiliensis]
MILGLTGGIASGKSTVAAMLRQRGIPVVDADLIARQVVEPGLPAYQAIVSHFGQGVLFPDGQLNRKALGEIVFSNEEQRQILNGIVHPEVRREMRQQTEAALKRGEKIVFLDIPLLFESRLQHTVDKIVVVYVPASLQLSRLMQRDDIGEEQALKRLQAQLPIEQKKEQADFVIDNQGTREETERQVEKLLATLAAESSP